MVARLVSLVALALLLASCDGSAPQGEVSLATVYDAPAEVAEPGFATQEEHPAACEHYALMNALRAVGIEAAYSDAVGAMDGFVGDPDRMGWAYPEAFAEAANELAPGSALDVSGTGFDEVAGMLGRGVVALWITTDYGPPHWSGPAVWDEEHVVVMYEVLDDAALLSDSLRGKVQVDLELVRGIWESCGSLAVLIGPAWR